MYLFARRTPLGNNGFVRLLGSGAILREVIQGSRLLEAEWCVSSEVWSITSYAELALDARAADRRNRLNPSAAPIQCHLAASLPGEAAVIAASDYVCAYPRLIAGYVEGRFTPWNGWLWPQRHARRSARLLRGRPPSCCDRRAFSACFSRRDCERQGRRGDLRGTRSTRAMSRPGLDEGHRNFLASGPILCAISGCARVGSCEGLLSEEAPTLS